MDDIHDRETSAIRRSIRRIEDDVAELERKKAGHVDVEPLATKQADMDSFMRTRLNTIQAENEETRRILNNICVTLATIDDRLIKLKRDTDTEVQLLKTPALPPVPAKAPGSGLPIQIQIIMYILIGVGILAILQSGPGAIAAMFDRAL